MADDRQVRTLIAQLRSQDAAVRQKAATRLGQMGDEAMAAIPALIQTLQRDADKGVIGVVTFALSQMGEAAVPLLIDLLEIPRLRLKVC